MQEQRRKEREAAKAAEAAKLAAKVAEAANKAGGAAAAQQGEPAAAAAKADEAAPPPPAEVTGEPIPEPAMPKAPQLQVRLARGDLGWEWPPARLRSRQVSSSPGAARPAAEVALRAVPAWRLWPGSWWACTRRACA